MELGKSLVLFLAMYLTIACSTKPEQRHIGQPATYELATKTELDRMQLSTGEVRKALLLISDTHTPDESFFQSAPDVFVMKEGYRDARYSVCRAYGAPSVEMGKDGEGFPIIRVSAVQSVHCFTVTLGNNGSIGQSDFTQFTRNNPDFWFRLVPKKKALFVMFSGLESSD